MFLFQDLTLIHEAFYVIKGDNCFYFRIWLWYMKLSM